MRVCGRWSALRVLVTCACLQEAAHWGHAAGSTSDSKGFLQREKDGGAITAPAHVITTDLPPATDAPARWAGRLEALRAMLWLVRNTHPTSEWVRVDLDETAIAHGTPHHALPRVTAAVSVAETVNTPSRGRLTRNARPTPLAILGMGMGTSTLLNIPTNSAVYIIVCNSSPSEDASMIAMSVTCCRPPKPRYHFDAPRGESVSLSWAPLWDTGDAPANVAGIAVRVCDAIPRDPADPLSPVRLEEYWMPAALPPNATNASIDLRMLKGRLGNIGIAPKLMAPAATAGPSDDPALFLPLAWADQDISVCETFWDASEKQPRRRYRYRTDMGGTRILEGLDTRWYRNGSREIEGPRKRNREHGVWQRWWESGTPFDRLVFDNGQRIGPYAAWSHLNAPLVTGRYDKDRKVGEWEYRYPNGRPEARGAYRYDVTTHYAYGVPSDLDMFDEGLHHRVGNKTGIWTYYSTDQADCEPTSADEGESGAAVKGEPRWLSSDAVTPVLNRPSSWARAIPLDGAPNLHRVSETLYRGAQPTEEGMRNLRALGIKTIVNLRVFHSDRDEIGDISLNYEHIPMKAWNLRRADVIRFLRIVSDPQASPVMVHCLRGSDRTGAMCAAYRTVVQGWSKEAAVDEMLRGGFGFHPAWENIPERLLDFDSALLRNELGIGVPSAHPAPGRER